MGLLIAICLLSSNLFAQKRKLEPTDYGQWQSISTTRLSADGKWFAYRVNLENGNEWLTIKKIGSDSTDKHTFSHAEEPTFTKNSRWAAFLIGTSQQELKELKKEKKNFHFDMGLMDLQTARVDTFKDVQHFTFSNDGQFLVMQKYPQNGPHHPGTDLVLRNLTKGTNQLIGNVTEYAFNKTGNQLAVILESSHNLGNGVQLYSLKSNNFFVLDSDTTRFTNLSWDADGTRLAFLKAFNNKNFKDPSYQIYVFQDIAHPGQKMIFDQRQVADFPDSFRIVNYRDLQWSSNHKTIFFGIKKWETANKVHKKSGDPSDTVASMDEDFISPNVEVWHWKDDEIQPQQELIAQKKRRDNFLAAWHLDRNSFIQIGSTKFNKVELTGDQRYAIGYDSSPYEPAFEEDWRDIYLINVETGTNKKIIEHQENVTSSPNGKYLIYFKNKNWWTYDIARDKHLNITQNIETHFENFTNVNGRKYKRPFGLGSWNKNDQWVIAYDQFDVYKLWADGSKKILLTDGKKDKIRYRQVELNHEAKGLANDDTIYFSMFGELTKDRGYARLSGNKTRTLIYEPKMVDKLTKADSSQTFIYQIQTAIDSPDFFAVNNSFDKPTALTHTNPQQKNYYWADDMLVTFTNKDGKQLEGRLLYPANYKPGKKYPMITYVYEKRSQTLHSYSLPSSRDPYNFRRYSSEGYFVFQPDITYKLGNPGISAVNCVVPAIEKMIGTGMIDKDKIGLTGHSWGGYQAAFISTQTDLFHSAVAGAPLANMISMYNSIYWNSGTPDSKIFETSQGRFPDPWWKDWDNYIKNSPIFNLEHMTTPLLVEFGTKDGAVDFNQGVELYNTMRRMQHPFVMLVYEGENHSLAGKENQIDYANRAFQWHEHYLRGKAAPDWIKKGISYLKRPAAKKIRKE